jgi:hypothetical protein
MQDKASGMYEKGRQEFQRRKDTLSAAVEAGRQAYREASSAEND